MSTVFWCKNCLNMSTRPRIRFDSRGYCNACTWSEEKKKIDWSEKTKLLEETIDKIKKNKKKQQYDCLVPVSGGKDGSYVSYQLKHKYNLNALAVTIRPPMELKIGKSNLENFINSGYDHVHVTPNFKAIRKVDKQGFIIDGQGYYGWLTAILSGVLRVATQFNINLIFYAEDGEVEYGGSQEYKNVAFFGVDYMKKAYLSDKYNNLLEKSKLKDDEKYWLTFPDNLNSELKITHYSFFENWDPYRNYIVAKKHCGLDDLRETNVGTFTNFAQNDQILASLHYYLMYLKFGFGRATQDAGIEIRRGALGRDQAINLVKLYDGKFPQNYLKYFLNYFEMNEKEFFNVLDNFANKEILEKIDNEWKLKIDIN